MGHTQATELRVNMLDKELYKEFYLDIVERLADREYQQKAWVENSLPRVADSPTETLCQLFDDLAAEKNIPILLQSNKPLLAKFQLLLRLFDTVAKDTKVLSDDACLDSKEWRAVIQQAQRVLEHIKKHGWEKTP